VSSAAAASPAAAPVAAPPAFARSRRPSVLSVYRWELRKLLSQKRTYLGLALVIILPLIFVVFEGLHHMHNHADNIFATEITQSGLATPVLMLLFMSGFFLPLAASLVSGDIFANEDGNGTLKTILTRSVDRGQVFAAKALAAMTYAASAVFLSAAVSTLAGVISWGFHSVRTFSGTDVSAGEALLLVFASNAVYLIPLFTVAAIGVLLSATTRNSAAAVVGTIGLVILLFIVAQIPGLEGIQPYLLTEQFQAWQGLLRTPTDWAPIAHSAWVCALYGVPALFAGYLVFLRRDVAGG
jgi:ABC-2 type transport system permease protein